jgi:hypothetical protein
MIWVAIDRTSNRSNRLQGDREPYCVTLSRFRGTFDPGGLTSIDRVVGNGRHGDPLFVPLWIALPFPFGVLHAISQASGCALAQP